MPREVIDRGPLSGLIPVRRRSLGDRIENPAADWVEVRVCLDNGLERRCAFTTPAHLPSRGVRLTTVEGDEVLAHWGVNMLVVSHLTVGAIRARLDYLDRQGELERHSIEIEPDVLRLVWPQITATPEYRSLLHIDYAVVWVRDDGIVVSLPGDFQKQKAMELARSRTGELLAASPRP